MSDKLSIALDPVAAHLSRKAAFFENECLVLASQLRDAVAAVKALQPELVADETIIQPEADDT